MRRCLGQSPFIAIFASQPNSESGETLLQVAEASVKAFVFLNVEPGQSPEVLKELIQVEGVSTCYVVLGIYDVVAVVESSSVEQLKAVVQEKIRKIDYVRATMTTIVA